MSAQNLDLSVGFSQEEVETLFATHKRNLLKLNATFAESGSSVTARSIRESERIIGACQKQLRRMAPELYGKPANRIVTSSVSNIPI